MNKLFWAILLSISPISELRGGIPYILTLSSLTNSNILILPLICIIANILIVIPIFFFLDFLHFRLLKLKPYKKLSDVLLKRIWNKSKELEPKINRYGYLALALFVAIPFPLTGAWTGTIIAWMLGLNKKKSFIAIAAGVLIAGIVVTLITLASLGALRLLF